MCSPSFIHFILSYIRVVKLREKANGYKKSIREFKYRRRLEIFIAKQECNGFALSVAFAIRIKELSFRMIHIFRRHKNTWHFNVSRCLGSLSARSCYLMPSGRSKRHKNKVSSRRARKKGFDGVTTYKSPYTQSNSENIPKKSILHKQKKTQGKQCGDLTKQNSRH